MFYFIFLYFAFVVIMIKLNNKRLKFSNLLLPAVMFSIILSIDFSINYSAALNFGVNDGISLHGILMNNFFREDSWDIFKFYKYYEISGTVSILLVLTFMILLVIDKVREVRN